MVVYDCMFSFMLLASFYCFHFLFDWLSVSVCRLFLFFIQLFGVNSKVRFCGKLRVPFFLYILLSITILSFCFRWTVCYKFRSFDSRLLKVSDLFNFIYGFITNILLWLLFSVIFLFSISRLNGMFFDCLFLTLLFYLNLFL